MPQYFLEVHWEIAFQSRWHAGSGVGGGIIDRTVVRDYRNRPYVPGATVKGVVRNNGERLAAAVGFRNIKDPNDPVGLENFCAAADSAYIVDRLFGSSYSGESLFFRDAVLSSDHIGSRFDYVTISRNQRERLTGVTAPDHLYSTEEVMPMRLCARVSARHSDASLIWARDDAENIVYCEGMEWPLEYSLLLGAIAMTDRIGGSRSRGLGHFIPLSLSASLNGQKVGEPLRYVHYLKTVKELAGGTDAAEGVLEAMGWW